MDGKHMTTLHNTRLSNPYGLAVDYGTQTLYWTDYTYGLIESSNTDGSNRQIITTAPFNPFTLTVYEGKMYWAERDRGNIYSASITSTAASPVGSYVSNPVGIRIVAQETQPHGMYFKLSKSCLYISFLYNQLSAPSPCSLNNGGCSHICLRSGVTDRGYQCSCPEHMELVNHTNCTAGNLKGYLRFTAHMYFICICYTAFEYMYIATRRYMFRANINGSGLQQILNYYYIHAIDFDYR